MAIREQIYGLLSHYEKFLRIMLKDVYFFQVFAIIFIV
ncbi:hypothetical protein CHY_1623 [Carboxydothermus hydrogenoformans Z-2901]|uniref:Uncharacterized protein n=1 Tax=Carboxydothermus hydrogenoformans (strain ATCC BAA-161 / DSM 6008 / Z-2901) TaxID=246194 RepID=Q3ABN8_CARHZ|nr:hypothetical protein CHY_1623 [Carboxydothermus hydrogenoformans Z-2901]